VATGFNTGASEGESLVPSYTRRSVSLNRFQVAPPHLGELLEGVRHGAGLGEDEDGARRVLGAPHDLGAHFETEIKP
jgi:hypothetical protein